MHTFNVNFNIDFWADVIDCCQCCANSAINRGNERVKRPKRALHLLQQDEKKGCQKDGVSGGSYSIT